MHNILTIIAPLFLIIFGAAIAYQTTKIGEKWSEAFNEFALKVGFPVLIFTALSNTSFSFKEEATLIIVNSTFILTSFLIAYLIIKTFKVRKSLASTLFICFAFLNIAYLGMPVLEQVYGEEILGTASLIVAIYIFWVFTVGLGYLDYNLNHNTKNIFKTLINNFKKNTLLISVVLGLIFSSLQITLPTQIMTSLEMISASVTPIVLIVIGLFIGKSKIGKITEWKPVFAFSITTLMILPAIFYLGLKLFGYNPVDFSTSIIDAAMPLAITPFALADQYKLDKTFISRSIVLSTTLSILTLPFWIFLVN